MHTFCKNLLLEFWNKKMEYEKINGLEKKISKIILGNDNQRIYSKAIKLWDHWYEKGGNTFDCSTYYNEGRLENFLGNWINLRKIEKQIVVISKAGSENTKPDEIPSFIKKSLERLNLEILDIFILHHDNENVPSNEFIDVLNQEINKKTIKVFGASNWKIKRFEESLKWSHNNNKIPFSILNNNLSLAKMHRPLWNDCVSSNDNEYLNFLNKNKQAHFSWSSQARGFFIKDSFLKKLLRRKFHKYLKDCFLSSDNLERKKRATQLALKYKCKTNDVALSWVLNQNFPSFAIIGAKKIDQINFSLNCLKIKLNNKEIEWLNLNS